MKRYDIDTREGASFPLVESEDGDWVSANESLDMIMSLRKELEKLKQDNEYLKQLIERMDNRLGTY